MVMVVEKRMVRKWSVIYQGCPLAKIGAASSSTEENLKARELYWCGVEAAPFNV